MKKFKLKAVYADKAIEFCLSEWSELGAKSKARLFCACALYVIVLGEVPNE